MAKSTTVTADEIQQDGSLSDYIVKHDVVGHQYAGERLELIEGIDIGRLLLLGAIAPMGDKSPAASPIRAVLPDDLSAALSVLSLDEITDISEEAAEYNPADPDKGAAFATPDAYRAHLIAEAVAGKSAPAESGGAPAPVGTAPSGAGAS